MGFLVDHITDLGTVLGKETWSGLSDAVIIHKGVGRALWRAGSQKCSGP